MATNAVKMFPRGYGGGAVQDEDDFELHEGHPDVNRLYEIYTSPNSNAGSWVFRRQVLKTAMQVFSTKWFADQDRNRHLHGYNYDFLIDTLKYVSTGKRQLPIYTWRELLIHHPKTYSANMEGRDLIQRTLSEYRMGVPVETFIQKWCTHKGGFDDMVETMNLLFGRIHIKIDD